jgi:arylsulfatase A-like enzyme
MPQNAAPNIIVIMGDDIGWFNLGSYHQGMMAGRTPNLDRMAAEGMRFTDYYAEASCTAGRANFITGQLPIRTGLTTVGQAGRESWDTGRSTHHCYHSQGDWLRDGPVRKESLGRSQRISAHSSRL